MENEEFPEDLALRSEYEKNEKFNAWVDEKNGEEILIEEIPFLPSWILYNLEFNEYQRLFHIYEDEELDSLKETIYYEFPPLIAHPFFRCNKGFENIHQRLDFLRDTWEGIIYFLLAIVSGESLLQKLDLKKANINNNLLFSWKFSDKLLAIERILLFAENNNLRLNSLNLITADKVQNLRNLNDKRNGFSHSSALSEEEAQRLFDELFPEVIDVLKQISRISEYKVLRYKSAESPIKLKFEVFKGHHNTRSFDIIEFNFDKLNLIKDLLNTQNLLFLMDSEFFCISPFLSFKEKSKGNATSLCYFKKIEGKELIFGIVGETEEERVPLSKFINIVNQIKVLT